MERCMLIVNPTAGRERAAYFAGQLQSAAAIYVRLCQCTRNR